MASAGCSLRHHPSLLFPDPQRHTVLAMRFLAMFIAYTDRVNISLASVAVLVAARIGLGLGEAAVTPAIAAATARCSLPDDRLDAGVRPHPACSARLRRRPNTPISTPPPAAIAACTAQKAAGRNCS